MSDNLLGGSIGLKSRVSGVAVKINEVKKTIVIILALSAGCFFYAKNGLAWENIYVQKIKTPSIKLTKETNFGKDGIDFKLLTSTTKGACVEPKARPTSSRNSNQELEKKLENIVGDYPIRETVPFIAKFDRKVAAFIVGIGKKESNWGKHAPSKNGKTCYNYWGYKGAGSLGTVMGYGCFASPEEGVEKIGKRIQQLVEKKLDTPDKMVIWKCGSNCAATGGHVAAQKWISDVNIYYEKIAKENKLVALNKND